MIKKIWIPALIGTLLLSYTPNVSAQVNPTINQTETTTTQEKSTTEVNQTEATTNNESSESTSTEDILKDLAGVTPDSFLYPVERLIESVQISLTFSDGGKAELLVEFANERLAEVEIMTAKDKLELAEEVMKEYVKTIGEVNKKAEELIKDDKEISNVLESIELTEGTANNVVIKLTGTIPEEAATQLTDAITIEVYKTLAVKSFAAAKENFFLAKKDFEIAKEAYKAAKETGDEAAIKAAYEKMVAAELYKDQMEQLKDEVEEFKEMVKEELKEAEKVSEELKKKFEKEEDEDEGLEEKAEKEKEKAEKKLEKEMEKAKKELEKQQKKDVKEREKSEKQLDKQREESNKTLDKARDHDDDDDKDDDHDDDDHDGDHDDEDEDRD